MPCWSTCASSRSTVATTGSTRSTTRHSATRGNDDRARTVGHALVATDSGAGVATSLVSSRGFTATSNGLLGRNDGWTDLADDHQLDNRATAAGPGNVVQTGLVAGLDGTRGHQRTTLTLGFGGDAGEARRTARAAAQTGFPTTARRYNDGWHRYLGDLKPVPASAAGVRRQYLASALVLAASEDKQTPGAIVASPSAPWVWGDEVDGLSSPSGAYHLVWARDSYEFGTALWADGDRAAARRIVDFLFDKQQKPDGSFPQNSDTTGKEVWTELQLDETALPIVLAHLVGRDDAATYAHVKKAADFIAGFKDPDTGLKAPFSPQERWENQSGYSPNSIAAQIAGLVCAADIARRNGDDASAKRWLALADSWRAKVKDWTVTTNGPLSDKPYFLRLTKDGKPNAGTTYGIGDGGPSAIDQRAVVDPSFLDLVRYGILAPDDPDVLSTLPVIDKQLEVRTPNGPFWHRFSHDGYGERRDGGQWDITDPDTFTTLGRGWPLLTGERGEYAVAAGRSGASYLKAMAARDRVRGHARRAGLGRARADRPELLRGRGRAPGRPRHWCGRTPDSSGWRGRSSWAARPTSSPSWRTGTSRGRASGYSAPIAVSTSSRAARLAGSTAASTPASAAKATNSASCHQGIASTLTPWSAMARCRAIPNTSPMPTPRTAPRTATTTDSSRTMRRSCRRLTPTARSSPISRVRSMTDRASVFTMPSRAMTTARPSSA